MKKLQELLGDKEMTKRVDEVFNPKKYKHTKKLKKQIKDYGFHAGETYDLGYAFYLWLYTRLKMYLDVNIIDLDFHRYTYQGEEYTARMLIDRMLELIELIMEDDYVYLLNKENSEVFLARKEELFDIFKLMLEDLWW